MAIPTALLLIVSRDDFAVTNVSGATLVFRVHIAVQILTWALLVSAFAGCLFLNRVRLWLVLALIPIMGAYALSLHMLASSWPTGELAEHYWPLYAKRLALEPPNADVSRSTCSRSAFTARFVNEQKEAMKVFLGVHPWRIDWEKFDEFFKCARA